jgi:hypothetical protein
MGKTVLYFGFGANRDVRMMSAILGKPKSELKAIAQAILEGYELVVQTLEDIPDTISPEAPIKRSPRSILEESWDDSFRSYAIRRSSFGHRVSGTIWEITPFERERVRDWELIDFGWAEDYLGLARTNNGHEVQIVTERLPAGQKAKIIVNGLLYPTWLQPPERFEAIAEKARQEYDQRVKARNFSQPQPA